jgi:signal transduction histidine kinase
MFESAASDRIRLQVDLEEGLAVRADAGQIRQVLWNLLLNAAQAMPDGGDLGVSARSIVESQAQAKISEGRLKDVEKAVWAEMAVMDQGVGIPPEALDRVFDPFFTTKRGGSGLGLATVHRIVEDHGGSVRLESSGDDWSTVVRVRLPLAEPAR